ncbi:AAA family ATPase [Acinetobacter haemolyticus]|uniref:AAA family ATPase n=1 Tax=Acinetobacter haemolyticus TaxID=29430 RepID=UPI00031A24C4|nr:AAA family ATPase [Acinetobacter haemolyticus]
MKPLLTKVELLNTIPDDFPFLHLYPLEFKKNITVITGENGSGKSTILEALALKFGCSAEGGTVNFNYKTEDTHLDYSSHLRIQKSPRRIRDIFFYRSETYYNFLTEMRQLDNAPSFGPPIRNFYGGKDLHTLSHGEAMKALIDHRFRAEGLYILDEPESALSVNNQINFVEKVIQLSKQGAQFIIATHSPILMLMPDIQLLQLNENSLREVNFTDTHIYYMYKEIINSNGDYLNQIIDIE